MIVRADLQTDLLVLQMHMIRVWMENGLLMLPKYIMAIVHVQRLSAEIWRRQADNINSLKFIIVDRISCGYTN